MIRLVMLDLELATSSKKNNNDRKIYQLLYVLQLLRRLGVVCSNKDK